MNGFTVWPPGLHNIKIQWAILGVTIAAHIPPVLLFIGPFRTNLATGSYSNQRLEVNFNLREVGKTAYLLPLMV